MSQFGRLLDSVMLSEEELRFVESRSPLVYHRSPVVNRLALVDSSAGDPDSKDYYFAETKKLLRKKDGSPYKVPKYEVTPGADQGVLAFLDWHEYGSNGVYLDYMKTRSNTRGRGYARMLVDKLIDNNPGLRLVHFGRVMHPSVWNIGETLKKSNPGLEIIMHKDF